MRMFFSFILWKYSLAVSARSRSIVFISVLSLVVRAQIPVPAPRQMQPIVLKGGTVHVGNGTVIENGTIKFENGKITYVGVSEALRVDVDEKVIDTRGKHIYPGLIAPNTVLGLVEIDAARPTRDFNEVGDLNPNVRALVAYNTDSRIIPTVRTNGILLAQITPKGGIISGLSSIVQLDAWNWEDAAYKTDVGIHLNWPSISIKKGWWAEPESSEINKKYLQATKKIDDFFAQAKAYCAQPASEKNLKLEAMCGVFSKTKKLFVHVGGAKEMMEVVAFKKKYEVDVVIVGGEEAHHVADLLKENNVPVILHQLHSLPSRTDDDIDLPYKLPFLLKQAGVTFCFSTGGSWQQRNLPFIAGTAVAYGLSKEEALAAITSSTAKILGIEKITGTIEVGKDANIVVTEGDILDMRFSKIIDAYIQGRKIELDNHQIQLYKKFSGKYEN
jgi:imidazolonepropionase-like amidohydrolase